jgi:hypothetical protein
MARTATGRLEAAQAAIEEANHKLAELNERRNQCLLRDNDTEAAKLSTEIENLQRLVHGHRDKINLLRDEAQREEQARRVKERAALIGRIEVKLDLRDRAMTDVAAAIKQLATASEKAIKINREIVAAWSWEAHDLPAALLTPPAVMTAISHEAYRVSYKPRRYGGQDTDPLAGLSLPGSKCPRLEWMELPEKTRPMAEVVKDASEFARQFMRTGKGSAVEPVQQQPVADLLRPGAPTNGGDAPQRTAAEQRKIALEKQMEELAKDPAREAEYNDVVRALEQVHAEITATKQMERQHG